MSLLSLIKKIRFSLHRHPSLWLAGGIFVYCLIFIILTLWKYWHLGYNGLDLGIFNQVFYNSSWGNFYYFTIHPQSYLGDHFNLTIAALTPLYAIWRDPRFLLILQTIILALSACPLYKIARKIVLPTSAVLIAWAWLINPFVQNTNVFEFHELPLAVFLLFWVIIFWLEKKPGLFYLFALLAVCVREDVALVVMMFGFLALIEKRSAIWYWIFPAGLGWFLMATKIISLLNPIGQYKFLYYYQWLGTTPAQMILNAITKPWLIFDKIVAPQNLAMTVALFLPFAFINFRWSKYWLLALPIYFQLILGGSLNALVVTKTHYSNLLLPTLFLIFCLGIAKYQRGDLPKWWQKIVSKEKVPAAIIASLAIIYVALALGPVIPWINQAWSKNLDSSWPQIQWQITKTIPAKASVLASYALLSPLSSRPKVYALNYAFTGKEQLSDKDYQVPPDLDLILMDSSDIILYQLQAENSAMWTKQFPTGNERLRQLISQRKLDAGLAVDSIIRFDKFTNSPNFTLWTTSTPTQINHPNKVTADGFSFLGWNNLAPTNFKPEVGRLLPISLIWQANQKIAKDWQLQLTITNKNNKEVYQKIYALAYGLYPTSEWQPNETTTINYWFYLPPNISKDDQLNLKLIYPKGYLSLDGLSTLVPKFVGSEFGPTILSEPLNRF